MEHRKRGVQFIRDGDGDHTVSINVRTVNAVFAFLVQLGALVGLLWGVMTPYIDRRIDGRMAGHATQIRTNTDWIIEHKAVFTVGRQQMEQFRISSEAQRQEILVELRRINERLDKLYERTR